MSNAARLKKPIKLKENTQSASECRPYVNQDRRTYCDWMLTVSLCHWNMLLSKASYCSIGMYR